MNYLSLLVFFCVSQLVISAPIIVTRVHTAEAVTTTDTYTTVTNTFTAPTVEVLVSDGATYTLTLTDADDSYPEPTTFTSFINKEAAVPTTTTLAPAVTVTTNDGADAIVEQSTNQVIETDVEITSTAISQVPTVASNIYTSNFVITLSTAIIDPQTTSSTLTSTSTTSTPVVPTTSTTEAVPTTSTTEAVPTTSTTEAVPTTQTTAAAQTTSTSSTSLQAPTAIVTQIATRSDLVTVTTSSTSTTSSTTSTSTSTGTGLHVDSVPTAIVYSPYENDSSCKTYDTVYSDLSLIKSVGISKIRVYGTDCNSISTILTAAENLDITVNQGFWISAEGADSIDDGVNSLISWVENDSQNGWAVFDFITIGNEAVISDYLTAPELIAKISSVKAQLQAAGYTGKVATSEPPVSFENYPELCTASEIDIVGINPHAYFDTYSSAQTAGTFVQGQYNIVKAICGDLDVLVTETGYPSAGIQNGGNIPSLENQAIAIAAILDSMDNEVTILSTYNDYWKSAGTYGIEQSFGTIQLYE